MRRSGLGRADREKLAPLCLRRAARWHAHAYFALADLRGPRSIHQAEAVVIGKPDTTRRGCSRCGKPTFWRRCDVLNGLCYACATGRPRLLTPETLAEYARTSRHRSACRGRCSAAHAGSPMSEPKG